MWLTAWALESSCLGSSPGSTVSSSVGFGTSFKLPHVEDGIQSNTCLIELPRTAGIITCAWLRVSTNER